MAAVVVIVIVYSAFQRVVVVKDDELPILFFNIRCVMTTKCMLRFVFLPSVCYKLQYNSFGSNGGVLAGMLFISTFLTALPILWFTLVFVCPFLESIWTHSTDPWLVRSSSFVTAGSTTTGCRCGCCYNDKYGRKDGQHHFCRSRRDGKGGAGCDWQALAGCRPRQQCRT